MKRIIQFFIAAIFGIHAGIVCAQSDELSAKDHFDEGTALYSAGQYEDAAVHFRLAHELKPSWKLWFNIGQSEAACRRFGLALEAFEKYLALGGDNVTAERFQDVVTEMRRLRELVGKLDIASGPDGAQVVVDGIARASLPLEVDLRVTAGIPHDLKIVGDDNIIHQQTVTVGSTSSVSITLDDTSGKALARSDRDNDNVGPGNDGAGSGDALQVDESITLAESQDVNVSIDQPRLKPLKVAMISSWIGAVATLGLGIGFNAAAAGKETELNDLNSEYEAGAITLDAYNQQYQDTQDAMDTSDTLANVMWISSGVLAATAIVTTIVYVKRKRPDSSRVAVSPDGVAVQF